MRSDLVVFGFRKFVYSDNFEVKDVASWCTDNAEHWEWIYNSPLGILILGIKIDIESASIFKLKFSGIMSNELNTKYG